MYEDRTTPENIQSLKDNEVFVFGSNESGIHGLGAAKTAMRWGANYGQAFGQQGKTFAIPTVNDSITNKLPLEKIKVWIAKFIIEASANPNTIYLVTRIGTGLAGWSISDIAPLFKECKDIPNIHLPKDFWGVILS